MLLLLNLVLLACLRLDLADDLIARPRVMVRLCTDLVSYGHAHESQSGSCRKVGSLTFGLNGHFAPEAALPILVHRLRRPWGDHAASTARVNDSL